MHNNLIYRQTRSFNGSLNGSHTLMNSFVSKGGAMISVRLVSAGAMVIQVIAAWTASGHVWCA
ncbi:hypothetical protein JVT61DRAFT_12216 [Boletus reticuloceps]|uniref:Uncharacterized protein n=1 Tax=Boletus reticuloceps TaxID=495285 RepID=A0A8I3A377_9AGAM|nr:hypothetical protein JVT61DRAFT_12216 [Boletus reticuloceps]